MVWKGLAPMQHLDALTETTGVEGIAFHDFEYGGLRLSFDDPEASTGNILRFFTKRPGNKDCSLVLLNPSNVRFQTLSSQLPMTWLVSEEDGEQHLNEIWLA